MVSWKSGYKTWDKQHEKQGGSMPKVSIDQPAPDFSLTSFSGEPFRLSDLQGTKNVLLVFNRTFT
jgi:cytochrome oxidase Cu insertion factor (SCO1/SenC/PrrC family)